MLVSPHALKRTAAASAKLAAVAERLLDVAARTEDPEIKTGIVSEAQRVLDIARELIAVVDSVALVNSAQSGLFGLADAMSRPSSEAYGRNQRLAMADALSHPVAR